MTTLADMRQRAADHCERAVRAVGELERELVDARAEQDAALAELNYWGSVREPDEVLMLCLVEGDEQSIITGQDIVRDGVPIRVCMERVPCPVHGRRLGGSDWRLHPVNGGRMTDEAPTREQVRATVERVDAQLSGHGPRPCLVHPQYVVAKAGECPECAEKAASIALEHPLPDLPRPTPDL